MGTSSHLSGTTNQGLRPDHRKFEFRITGNAIAKKVDTMQGNVPRAREWRGRASELVILIEKYH